MRRPIKKHCCQQHVQYILKNRQHKVSCNNQQCSCKLRVTGNHKQFSPDKIFPPTAVKYRDNATFSRQVVVLNKFLDCCNHHKYGCNYYTTPILRPLFKDSNAGQQHHHYHRFTAILETA